MTKDSHNPKQTFSSKTEKLSAEGKLKSKSEISSNVDKKKIVRSSELQNNTKAPLNKKTNTSVKNGKTQLNSQRAQIASTGNLKSAGMLQKNAMHSSSKIPPPPPKAVSRTSCPPPIPKRISSIPTSSPRALCNPLPADLSVGGFLASADTKNAPYEWTVSDATSAATAFLGPAYGSGNELGNADDEDLKAILGPSFIQTVKIFLSEEKNRLILLKVSAGLGGVLLIMFLLSFVGNDNTAAVNSSSQTSAESLDKKDSVEALELASSLSVQQPVKTVPVEDLTRESVTETALNSEPAPEPASESVPESVPAPEPVPDPILKTKQEKETSIISASQKDVSSSKNSVEKANTSASKTSSKNNMLTVSSNYSSNERLPITISREAVQSGLNGVASKVKKCGKKETRPIVMAITIGKNGKVSDAVATGVFTGTEVGRCAALAVITAAFPKAQKNTTVKYPFQL